MKFKLGILWLLIILSTAWAQQGPEDRLAKAEEYYEEGSYRLAWEIYQAVPMTNLSPDEQRWIQFRTADSLWRSERSSGNADDTRAREAQKVLQEIVKDEAPQDSAWAAAQESLGDFHWVHQRGRNWGGAWPHYQKALEFWGGSTNLARAADHYLEIVWKCARPPEVPEHFFYGYHGQTLPVDVLENAVRIARNEEEEARAHFLLAMSLRQNAGSWDHRRRIPRTFEKAIRLQRDTEWYDDALFQYAEWMADNGRAVRDTHGNWMFRPDYVKAVELYRRFVNDFARGESRFYERAQVAIENITRVEVTASVPYIFAPGTEVSFELNWRNVDRIDLALFRINLTEDVDLERGDRQDEDWLAAINLRGAEKVKSWSRETGNTRKHERGHETIRLEEKLEPGAYLLETSARGSSHREIILVTDAALVLKSTGGKTLVYLCDAASGAPLGNGEVTIWLREHDGRIWQWRRMSGKTDQQGLAVFDENTAGLNGTVIAVAASGGRQAFSRTSTWHHRGEQKQWRIYAATDRPAYRPGETAHWKLTARIHDGQTYATPAGQKLSMKIVDPRGAEVQAREIEFNSFGSAWGEVPITSEMALGEYQVIFTEANGKEIGRNALFRLEEYKLPEFKVSIATPEEDGRKKAFLAGEKVEVEIQADYYYGGPVANATVEVVVRQRPFYQHWRPKREFPWFFEENQSGYFHGSGQVVQRETLRTDAFGKAALTIQSPEGGGEDLEFQIEARVTDASRREVTGTDSVRVTQQLYYVQAKPGHYLHRPGNEVAVEFTALDANQNPMAAEGTVRVTRDTWVEIWLNREGREVRGRELETAKRGPAGLAGWLLKFQGYEHDHILTQTVKTGTNGLATLSFTPEREGFYRVTWRSEDNPDLEAEIVGRPVETETTIWVADNRTTELGFHTGGVKIIADQETFRAGETAPVMLLVEGNDRHVLFTVEGKELISHELVHLSGSVKLVQLRIGEEHIPNVRLNATLVTDYRIHQDSQEVIVPPVKNFLTVNLEPGEEEYQPGAEGEFTLTLKDHEGKPVSAEVALSVVDESVFYIQQDLAGDPRQFFFGQRNPYQVQTGSSFNFRSYLSREIEADLLRAERQAGGVAGAELDGLAAYFAKDASGVAEGAMLNYRAKPAPAPMMLGAKLETASRQRAFFDAESAATAAPEDEQAVQVRSDFRTTIFWEPAVRTGPDGTAKVTVRYPDSLTGWKATARAVTTGNQFGIAHADTRTKKPLIVRLQAPRFFQVGDSVTVSAVLNNNTDEALEVRPAIEIEGMTSPENQTPSAVTVPAHGEQRVDWVVHPDRAGEAKITVIARGGKHNDAMVRTFPIHEHGIEKFLAVSGKVRGDEVTVHLDLPGERKPETTTMTVQVTPSLAVTMLDALPYLVHYPYGCTEQTMSRFLPAVITAKTLEDLGLHPEDVMSRAFGGIEPGSAAATHPDGKKSQLDEVVRAGLQRLYDFQHTDGGWGWWKEGDSDPFMTAYVLWGLVLAREADVELREGVITRAVEWLNKELVVAENSPDLQAWLLHALAIHHGSEKGQKVHAFQETAFRNLWENRDQLNAYTRALLALAAHEYGKDAEAMTLIRNLENGVQVDESPANSVLVKSPDASEGEMATAHWGEDGIFWRWSEGGVEATAFVLKALLAIDPENKLVEPVTNWLIKNRRGAQWSNTRDTAICLLTLNDYLRQSGELETELEFAVIVNGANIAERSVSKSDILSAPSRFEVPAEHLRNGKNDIRIVRKTGKGPLYFAAEAEFFSLEEPIRSAGHEIFAKREYYRLKPTPTLLNGYILAKEKMKDGERIESGERVEVVVTVEAKNNYEYLVFEDLKPAGLEAVEIQSGQALYARELNTVGVAAKHGKSADIAASKHEQLLREQQARQGHTGRTRYVYQELRDRKVALFLDKLPQGIWEMRYELRAEVPGEFHALPVLGHAMYVPEIRCNSEEMHLEVTERAEPKPAT